MRTVHVAVRTLPSMNDLAQGKVSLADVRELDLDDLLGREPVTPNHILLAKNIVGKVVLVTGAGGSIGSELCRQIWAKGGDVFVLDMGQPVRIFDLARRMIELSGLSVQDAQQPEGDIAIELSGLRPGEKLYEELLLGHNPSPTLHPRIMKAQDDFLPWAALAARLAELELALQHNDVAAIRHLLAQLVPGYTPSAEIVDWVYLQQQAG